MRVESGEGLEHPSVFFLLLYTPYLKVKVIPNHKFWVVIRTVREGKTSNVDISSGDQQN